MTVLYKIPAFFLAYFTIKVVQEEGWQTSTSSLAVWQGVSLLPKGQKRERVMSKDFRALAHLEEQLGEEGWKALIDPANTGKIKEALKGLLWFFTLVATVVVLRPPEFVARNKFKNGGAVKFRGFWSGFEEWFLDKVEKLADGEANQTTLRYQTLSKESLDGPIIDALGGEAKAETSLAEIHCLLEEQANGEVGALLTDGDANIFYVRDSSLVLRVVYVSNFGDGWEVGAGSVDDPNEWDAGDRVFSRDS